MMRAAPGLGYKEWGLGTLCFPLHADISTLLATRPAGQPEWERVTEEVVGGARSLGSLQRWQAACYAQGEALVARTA